jgi:hypothetical protein
LLEDLYGLWVDYAEDELADITGTALPKMGKRSGGPRLVWKSILPEVRRAPPRLGRPPWPGWRTSPEMPSGWRPPPSHEEDIRGHELIDILRHALEEEVTGKDVLVADGSIRRVKGILTAAEALVDDDAAPVDSRWIKWTAEAEAALGDLRGRHVKAAAGEPTDRLREWREWLRAGFERGANIAHAYMRLPAEWRPSEATSPEGLPIAEPSAVLNGQRDKYGRAWAANEDVGRYSWPDRQSLPRLKAAELREASLSFKKSTAIAYDGIHCRHYAMLCDAALTALGALLEVCELLGPLPRQARLVVTPLLDKPKGGLQTYSYLRLII